MLRLYYTGAKASGDKQEIVSNSLGGFVSSSDVASDFFGNFFGGISEYTTTNSDGVDYMMVALKNETGATVTDVMLRYLYPSSDSTSTLEIAAVAPSINECDEKMFEKIRSRKAAPIFGVFVDASASYAFADLEVTKAATLGDTIDIQEDAITLVTTAAFATSNPSIEDTVDAIVLAMAGHATYDVTKVSETITIQQNQTLHGVTQLVDVETTTFYARFTQKTLGVFTNTIGIDTLGSTVAPDVVLAGGSDNTQNLGNLEAGGCIGIWFKRTIRDSVMDGSNKSCEILVDNFKKNISLDTSEIIDIFIEWT